MTPKQKAALEHIFLYGSGDLSHISGLVLRNCCARGWILIDKDAPWAFGETLNDSTWVLTDAGREALHEASK